MGPARSTSRQATASTFRWQPAEHRLWRFDRHSGDRGELIKKIEKEVSAGYQRIKIKIKPGWDLDVVREVRRQFPSHPS